MVDNRKRTEDDQASPGGHGSELSNAVTRMADAIAAGDAAALREGAADHAAALGSQATAMIASIAKPVYGKLEEISNALDNMRRADLDRRTAESTLEETHRTRLYRELDTLEAGQVGIQAVVEATAGQVGKLSTQVGSMSAALDATIGRVDAIEELSHDHTLLLAAHDQRLTAVEDRTKVLEVEQAALRREIKRLAGDFARNTEELQRLYKEHGGGV